MSKQSENPVEKHFYVTVDGKKSGPYHESRRCEFNRLEHMRGVAFETVWLEKSPTPPKARKKKQEHPSLLEEIGFVPEHRTRYQGW